MAIYEGRGEWWRALRAEHPIDFHTQGSPTREELERLAQNRLGPIAGIKNMTYDELREKYQRQVGNDPLRSVDSPLGSRLSKEKR